VLAREALPAEKKGNGNPRPSIGEEKGGEENAFLRIPLSRRLPQQRVKKKQKANRTADLVQSGRKRRVITDYIKRRLSSMLELEARKKEGNTADVESAFPARSRRKKRGGRWNCTSAYQLHPTPRRGTLRLQGKRTGGEQIGLACVKGENGKRRVALLPHCPAGKTAHAEYFILTSSCSAPKKKNKTKERRKERDRMISEKKKKKRKKKEGMTSFCFSVDKKWPLMSGAHHPRKRQQKKDQWPFSRSLPLPKKKRGKRTVFRATRGARAGFPMTAKERGGKPTPSGSRRKKKKGEAISGSSLD